MMYKIMAILLIFVILLGSIGFAKELTREEMKQETMDNLREYEEQKREEERQEKIDKFIFGIANLILFTLIF